MSTYFCSDLHLGHRNILKYEPIRIDGIWEMFFKDDPRYPTAESFREYVLPLVDDFSDEGKDKFRYILSLHDKMLINHWNSVVSNEDTVWFLGDFCLGGNENVKAYLDQLNGHKMLIRGNHDKKTDSAYREAGFEYVSRYPIILKKFFVLSHAPFEYMTTNAPFFYIYGHVHSSPAHQTWTNISCCACVERHGFKPIQIHGFDEADDSIEKYHPSLENKRG